MSDKFRVVVLTCAPFGHETAQAFAGDDTFDFLGIIIAPYPRPRVRVRLRRAYRTHGFIGLLRLALRKVRLVRSSRTKDSRAYPIHHVSDFHGSDCLTLMRDLRPDLAIIDGTYILEPRLFEIPRLGSINLHCGKVPEYRGAPPVFWELYDGVEQVGVTVHRVTAGVDQGPVLLEASFPIEIAPDEDPVAYASSYWRDVLRPSGVRMLVYAAKGIARGTLHGTAQNETTARVRRTPTQQQVSELRKRVSRRRAHLVRG